MKGASELVQTPETSISGELVPPEAQSGERRKQHP